MLPSSPSEPPLVTSPADVTASSSDLPEATTCPVDVTARGVSYSDHLPSSTTPFSYPPAGSLAAPSTHISFFPAAAAGNNYLYLMMRRLRRWAVLGRCFCLSSGIFQARTPLTQVFFCFFWVSLLLMIALLVLVNTKQTRPSLPNHLHRFLVIFGSILLFFLSSTALVLRAFVWPPRGPLRKLGLTQSLFWYVFEVMGWAYVANVVQEEVTNSLISFFLLAVLSIPSSNVFLHTTTNLGLMDSLVGLCASTGYKIAKHKLVGFIVITLFVAAFAFVKFYSESYKTRYGTPEKNVDNIEKGYRENDDAYVLIFALGYATRNIIESLESGLRRIEESTNTSIYKAIDELLGANVDPSVIVGFSQIKKMVGSAIQDTSRNVIGGLEAALLPQLIMGLNIESIMGPVNEEMVTAIMDSATRNIISDIQMSLVDGIQMGLTQMYANSHKITTISGKTIPLTEDEVKEMFSNGTKNDHEASGSGT